MTQLFVADLLASVLHDRRGMMRMLGAWSELSVSTIGKKGTYHYVRIYATSTYIGSLYSQS